MKYPAGGSSRPDPAPRLTVRKPLRLGEEVELLGAKATVAVVTGIETFHQLRETAEAGENVGLLLRGVAREAIARGALVVRPGSVTAHAEGEAELFVLTGKEGGRHTPFGSGYMPQLCFGAMDVTGSLQVGNGGPASPGDRAKVRFAAWWEWSRACASSCVRVAAPWAPAW